MKGRGHHVRIKAACGPQVKKQKKAGMSDLDEALKGKLKTRRETNQRQSGREKRTEARQCKADPEELEDKGKQKSSLSLNLTN